VPSSTSSSNDRLPEGPWARTWIVAILLSCGVLGGYEAFWRLRGFHPELLQDAESWSFKRRQVRTADRQQTVLVGTSRMAWGVDPEVLAETLSCETPIQLALAGGSPIPVLHHLSKDESFQGIVVCEVHPVLYFNGVKIDRGVAGEYTSRYENQTAGTPVEDLLHMGLQQITVLRLPDVAPKELWRRFTHDESLPLPEQGDRDLAKHQKENEEIWAEKDKRLSQPGGRVPYQRFLGDLERLEQMVTRIHKRGGRVVFVLMPTSGMVRQIDEKWFPRKRFWDVLVSRTQATTVHFADHPTLASFRCPDCSHLQGEDVGRFSKELARIIGQKLAFAGRNVVTQAAR
jgi:hypothetical protein